MAHFIDGGTLMFDSLLYGRPHPSTQQFLASQFQQLSSNLTTAGQRFMESAAEVFEKLAGSEAERVLRAVGRNIRSMWQLDEIRMLSTIGELQTAPLTMQRWIMAEPMVRQMYHDQRVDGYSESYVDVHPGDIGESHYDYRRVMDGVLVDDEEPDNNGDPSWHATTYIEELLPEDRDLLLEEQVDILQTWEHVRAAIKRGKEDPTSRFNADLT